MRIVQLTDSHVTARGGASYDNLKTVVEYINSSLHPDLVVHTGDVVAADPDNCVDRQAVLDLLGDIEAPLRVCPGNHDVGEVGPEPWRGFRTTPERVAVHRAAFGPDSWRELAENWVIIGWNSQLLQSGIANEEEQWRWLEAAAADTRDRSVMVFSHKPLISEELPASPDVAIDEQARARLVGLWRAGRFRAFGSGHLHRYQQRVRSGVLEVRAPSVGVPPSEEEPPAVVLWDLRGDTVVARREPVPGLKIVSWNDQPELVAAVAEIDAELAAGRSA